LRMADALEPRPDNCCATAKLEQRRCLPRRSEVAFVSLLAPACRP